jgi:hypothetical protein
VSSVRAQVKAYEGFMKPKNHFVTHAARDTLKKGPMRERWCYSYEGFHQRVKHISKGSNWKNPCRRMMRFWCHQFAFLNSLHDPSERKRLNGLA